MPSRPHAYHQTKKQPGINTCTTRRAGAVELHPGDKVLVRLDSYKGANRKLVNRWSSTLHTVVGQIADDVPAYVIENDKGKQQVLHRA